MILQEIINLNVTLKNPLVSNTFELQLPNMEIRSNERIGVIGKSGAGKTTFARLLSGLLKPTTGTINSYPDNLSVGLSFQFPENQFYTNTILDDIMIGTIEKGFSHKEAHKSATEALELVNLNPEFYADRNHMSLSGGEKRKAALALIIALKPDLYIFDEPTAALDGIEIKNLSIIMNSISDLGNTIVIISQDSAFIAENCDRLIVFDKGLIVYDGPSIDFFLSEELTDKNGIKMPPVAEFVNNLIADGIKISPRSLKSSEIFSILESQNKSLIDDNLVQ